MEAVFAAFEEGNGGDYLEDGYITREGFVRFWAHLKSNSSLCRLLSTNAIIYLLFISFMGTSLLVISSIIGAATHNFGYVYDMKAIGYFCHLAFEVIVLKMEIRHWRANIEASRTIIHDYCQALEWETQFETQFEIKEDSESVSDAD